MKSPTAPGPPVLRVLTVSQGQWGERIADHVYRHCPNTWTVVHWRAPRALPPIVDDPADFLPEALAGADLILALGETAGLFQLIPEVAALTGARSVIAPIDRNESLPPGLAAQLKAWLAALDVTLACPKPFCSLTTTTYNRPPILVKYDDPLIRAFAVQFGRPRLSIAVDSSSRISEVTVERATACGCARAVAEGLAGCPVSEAEHQAGMLHHHFPCLASMNQDADYNDTLMHVSGNFMREAVKEGIRDYLEPGYMRPPGLAN